jgi:hypothetical protein
VTLNRIRDHSCGGGIGVPCWVLLQRPYRVGELGTRVPAIDPVPRSGSGWKLFSDKEDGGRSGCEADHE